LVLIEVATVGAKFSQKLVCCRWRQSNLERTCCFGKFLSEHALNKQWTA